jgi:hypothetical protein
MYFCFTPFHTGIIHMTEYSNTKYPFEYSIFTIHSRIFKYSFQLYKLITFLFSGPIPWPYRCTAATLQTIPAFAPSGYFIHIAGGGTAENEKRGMGHSTQWQHVSFNAISNDVLCFLLTGVFNNPVNWR